MGVYESEGLHTWIIGPIKFFTKLTSFVFMYFIKSVAARAPICKGRDYYALIIANLSNAIFVMQTLLAYFPYGPRNSWLPSFSFATLVFLACDL